MVILHLSKVPDDKCNGVAVVVPQHVAAQGKFADTALINLNGIALTGCDRQIMRDLDALPAPYDRPDLVVFHEVYKPEFLKAAQKFRKLGVPYIIVPHGCLTKRAQRIKWLKKVMANTLFFNMFINGAAAIQFLSEKEREQSPFRKVGFVGTNGMALPVQKKEKFSQFYTGFIYIGRLDCYHKGIDLMLAAANMSTAAMRESKSIIKLFGPDKQGMHQKIKTQIGQYGLFDIVTLCDAVTGGSKMEQLLDADIFLQTSRFEGMPMGILEALSYGIPCLVTEGTNLGELVRQYDAGWVANTDVDSISSAIRQAVCERHLWKNKSMNARRLIDECFGWESIARKTIEEYKKIMDSKED